MGKYGLSWGFNGMGEFSRDSVSLTCLTSNHYERIILGLGKLV